MAKSTFRIREQFESSAKIIEIDRFHFGEFTYPPSSGSDLNPDFVFHRKPGWWPKVPVLIQSDGLPWEIGNAYLLKILETKRPWDMETVKTRAAYLLAYLRFLEHNDKHFMHFPLRRSERVTYVFRDTLQMFINRGLAPQYASNIINAVVDFYRTIAREGLIQNEEFTNLPFKDIHRFIKYLDERGFGRLRNVTTSDLAIRHSKPHKRLDRINDGGQLRPLGIDEQKALLRAFDKKLCPYNLELMMRITLSTGARMQTVCTIRAHHIKTAYHHLIKEQTSSVEIQAGHAANNQGHLINTKNGKLHRLLFPRKLVEDLYIYLTSEYRQSLNPKSYYGDSDTNYLFLTDTGSPYYISNQEIHDRQNEHSHWSVNSQDFVQNKGDTVRMNLKKFLEKSRKIYPEIQYFKFHDLRATFGMNLVRKLSKKGYKSAHILSELKSRMGHRNIETTQCYLDFEQFAKRFDEVSLEFEEQLLSEYEDAGSNDQL